MIYSARLLKCIEFIIKNSASKNNYLLNLAQAGFFIAWRTVWLVKKTQVASFIQ